MLLFLGPDIGDAFLGVPISSDARDVWKVSLESGFLSEFGECKYVLRVDGVVANNIHHGPLGYTLPKQRGTSTRALCRGDPGLFGWSRLSSAWFQEEVEV